MEDVSVVSLVVRVVVSLGVVLAVMAGAAAVLRRGGFGGAGGGGGGGLGRSRAAKHSVEVIGRVGLGRNTSVTVVRVGGRALVLGVSDQKVTLLTETDPADLVPPSIDPESPGTAAPGGFPPASSAWKAVVEQLRERTVRR